MKIFQQLPQRNLLFRRSGVHSLSHVVKPPFIADPDAILVMLIAMSTLLLDRPTRLDRPVTPHHKVVLNTLPVLPAPGHPRLVPLINLSCRAGLVGTHTTTVYNQ